MNNLPLDQLARRLDGRLLRLEELPIDRSLIPELLSKNLLKKTPALHISLLKTSCSRCGNEDKRYFASIPCKKCGHTHLYCRNCIEMGRIMACEFLYYWDGPSYNWPKQEDPCTWEGTLTSAQMQAAERVKEAIGRQKDELLIWAVCGAGKTEMLFPGIAYALEQGLRICLATPRKDVVRELKPRLERAFSGTPVQTLYGGSKDKDNHAQLVIATTHQLFRYQSAFDVMIIDEIDAFPFHKDPSLPFAQKRAAKPACATIYLTATPRSNFKKRIRRGTLPHVFVPVRYHGHPLPVPSLTMCYALEKELKACQIPEPFLRWIRQRKQPKRQLLIFVPTIALTEQLQARLSRLLTQEKVIHTPEELSSVHADDAEREEKVMDFREKKLRVLITTTILERGVTFPSVDVAVLDAGHAVFDEAALVQIAGRAGRNAKDPTGEVQFFHEGKTEAMLEAIYQIKEMNKRGGSFR
jgi:competence protein ComFA